MKCFYCGGPVDTSNYEEDICEPCFIELIRYDNLYEEEDPWDDYDEYDELDD